MTENYHILQIIYNLCIFVLQHFSACLKNVAKWALDWGGADK